MQVRTREGLFCLGIGLCLALAVLVGQWGDQEDVQSILQETLPSADRFVALNARLHRGVVEEGTQSSDVGHVSLGGAPGYAGPIKTAVVWTADWTVDRVLVWQQSETKAFYRKLNVTALLEGWRGKACSDPFQLGTDIEAVTGATVSLEGLSESVRRAGRTMAIHAGVEVVEPKRPAVRIGMPEVILGLLYVVGVLAYLPGPRMQCLWRRASLILGVIALGWWLNRPVSLVQINALLLGYWPQWQTHLYWYLLIVALLLPVLLTGRSPYCSHVCPMGAVQQALRLAGGKQGRLSDRVTLWLRRFQRVLTLAVVVVALATRNPAIAQYEVTGTLFGLTGTVWQFGLLGLALIGSLFLVRPWCLMLCPLRAVSDFLRLIRRTLLGPKSESVKDRSCDHTNKPGT